MASLTFDDLRKEQQDFIGPPKPPQQPKLQRSISVEQERELEAWIERGVGSG